MMVKKPKALAALTRQKLLEIAKDNEVSGLSAKNKDEIVKALSSERKVNLIDILADLSRDELKAICNEAGLDDTGREKAVLIERIVGEDSPQPEKKEKAKKGKPLKKSARDVGFMGEVFDILQNLNGLDKLKKLFLQKLNYDRINDPVSTRGWTDIQKENLEGDPIILAGAEDFKIIYCKLREDRLLRTHERPVVTRLLRDHPYSLFIFSDYGQENWHFINVKPDTVKAEGARTKSRNVLRRIPIGPNERLRTATERISMLDVNTLGTMFPTALGIQALFDQAFDVEAVTHAFYQDYCRVFDNLRADLTSQTNNKRWAHDYTLQFMNRLMFIYFIQRKRRDDGKPWLGDIEFMKTFWEAYQDSGATRDLFFEKWLLVLFFHAFNNRLGSVTHLPDEFRTILREAPYLNGGLFTENGLDRERFIIKDSRFEEIFDFLEKYNFTITESTPLDQEVAVDPEMIGKVYESLVNVEEDIDERGEAGIFYTPRTEIDLMCRLSLVDNLKNKLGKEHRDLFYELVFAIEQDEKDQADERVTDEGLWEAINNVLRSITVCDPACGSGSFLVGMLQVLFDLRKRANQRLGEQDSDFTIKKKIIAESLYGVDVKGWAVHVAELRLWLSLMIETDLGYHELKLKPLLPNLSFKLRQGDSLIQEVAGINLSLIRERFDIPGSTKGKITTLKGEKIKFLYSEKGAKTKEEIDKLEIKTYQDILGKRVEEIENKISIARKKANKPQQSKMFDDGRPKQLGLPQASKEEVELFKAELDEIKKVKNAMKNIANVPFVWDIAFAEIFESEKEGFDIVIGNPPYVRQEYIAPPTLSTEEKKNMEENQFKLVKKEYKNALAQSVYNLYPGFFGYLPSKGKARMKIDAKCDLYIYFFFHGLALLNQKGSFCFITQNSWLDVGYGKNIQEFLLKRTEIHFIVDNQVKRSFASASVNTVISLFSSPLRELNSKVMPDIKPLSNLAKFIMFKVSFESIVDPIIFQEIEEIKGRSVNIEYRINTKDQMFLLDEGIGEGEELSNEQYTANKWGGKYLRAPDIYWKILEKANDKITRLDKIAEVRRGVTTGANDFFFVDPIGEMQPNNLIHVKNNEGWEGFIEKKSLINAVMKVDECDKLIFTPKKYIFYPPPNMGKLSREYIKYGESREHHLRATCSARTQWWKLPLENQYEKAIGFNYNIHDTGRSYLSDKSQTYYSDSFHVIACDQMKELHCYMNSSLFHLFININARVVFGGGKAKLQTYELKELPSIIDLEKISEHQHFNKLYESICDESHLIYEEIYTQKRKDFDKIIFDIIGLNKAERLEVYQALEQMIKFRLLKASSLT